MYKEAPPPPPKKQKAPEKSSVSLSFPSAFAQGRVALRAKPPSFIGL
jgi:hypothetical protein